MGRQIEDFFLRLPDSSAYCLDDYFPGMAFMIFVKIFSKICLIYRVRLDSQKPIP